VYAFGGEGFLSLLTDDAKVVGASSSYLLWATAIPFCGMAAFVWDGVFIGVTATRGMLLSSAIAAISFFLVYALLHTTLQNHALWLAFLVFLAMRGGVQSFLAYRMAFSN
jgi:multidrug resistance protein, MATE family